jgi:[1-hydroxy-2-(trimethylamino)ethyl]phosphonate dioxygenase
LRGIFAAAVTEPIRLHVAAKRVLVATDRDYAGALSPGSQASLRRQGGPASPAEVDEFLTRPFAEAAIVLRRYDDAGKVRGLTVPPFDDFLPTLRRVAQG